MKRIFKTMALSAIVIGMLASCQKNKQPVQDTLEVTPTELTFAGSDNEAAVIEVKTGAPEWNFSADGWITARKDGARLIVNVSDNPEYSVRTGKILFTAGSAKSVRVDVRQEARVKSSLELSTETIEAGSDGGRYEVTVTSAEKWTVSGSCDWCTLTPTEGKSGDKITVAVLGNDTEEIRTAEFTVTSGTVSKTLKVISTPEFFLFLSEPESGEKAFDSAGGNFNVVLRTNMPAEDIKVKIDSGDGWVTASQASSTSSGVTYAVKVSSNESYVSRKAYLTFYAEGSGQATVSVSQAQKNLVEVTYPSSGEYSLGTEATEISIAVRTNLFTSLTVSTPDWISSASEPQFISEEDGLSTYRYRFAISAASGSRAGNITFKYEQFEARVTVSQISDEAVYATIPDEVFRELLFYNEYIMSKDSEEVELTAEGQAATSLDFSFYTRVTTLEGIEAFTNLTSINLSGCNNIPVVDISGLHNVDYLSMGNCGYTERIILGDNPVTSFSYGWYTDVYVSSVSISGSRLESLDVSNPYSYFGDSWSVLDVTGCPALKSINSQREASLVIYVTQEQRDRITNTGNGVLTVR